MPQAAVVFRELISVTRQRSTEPGEPRQETALATPEAWRHPGWLETSNGDPARAFVLGALHALVRNGTATWTALEGGDVRLTCSSGIVLHLGQYGVTRLG
jgi:hypothetical protein